MFILSCGCLQICFGQETIPVNKLREGLPTLKEVGGLKRSVPILDAGEANVRYEKIAYEPPSYEVSISELPPSILALRESMPKFNVPIGVGEDGDGRSSKNVILKDKYKATESATKNSDGDCLVEFYIGKKISVSIRGTGTNNVKLIYLIIDSMALDKLEKLAQ